jgi:type I restriction enzyme S subunit
MESKRVPEIRFEGFVDEWEERKFSESVIRINTMSNSNTLPKIEFEDIIAGEGRLNKDISHKFDNRKGIKFKAENILYGKLRPYLKNWLYPDFDGIAMGDFWVFKAENSIPLFIYGLIQSGNFQKVANDTSGTKMPRSDWKKVSNTIFLMPCTREQEKIGSFFSQLDKAITLHQQNLENLKTKKKGLLQKMFPKEGEKVPEVRFPGYNTLWRSVKLVDVIKKQIKGTAQKAMLSDGEIEYLDAARLNGGEGYYTNGELNVEEEDILILWDGSKAGKLYNGFRGVLGSTLKAFRINENNSSQFVFQHLINKQDEIYMQYRTPNIPHVIKNFTDVFMISIPSLEEQQKIGQFFKQLDDKIALEERELKLLQETKKAFLQKMFV